MAGVPAAGYKREAGVPASALPAPLREIGFDQNLNQQIPLDIPFVDEQGREVELGRFFGARPVVLAFVYYECPMLCTQVLSAMATSLDVMSLEPGRDFEIVTISFDPRDTPKSAAAKKAVYIERYKHPGAAQAWHFLTGDPPAIERLAQAVGFRYTYVPEEKQFAHAAAIMVLTPDGRVSRYFFGVEYPPRDLRFGLIDAADRKIGTVVDHLLLYCYRYDPTTGRYGALAMNLVRAGGVVTVLAFGGFVLVMRRRETRPATGRG